MRSLHDYADARHAPRSVDPGCSSCGTCMCHDGCADADFPVDIERGDCETCGACAGCIEDCERDRANEPDPTPEHTEERNGD